MGGKLCMVECTKAIGTLIMHVIPDVECESVATIVLKEIVTYPKNLNLGLMPRSMRSKW